MKRWRHTVLTWLTRKIYNPDKITKYTKRVGEGDDALEK
jgi:hypothetical protein